MTSSQPRTKLTRGGMLVGPRQIAEQDKVRQMIAAAPVELVERDGRTFELRHLPGHGPRGDPPGLIPLLRHRRGFPVA